MSGTALSPAIVHPSPGVVLEARLRYMLDEMAAALDRAHMAYPRMAGLHLTVAESFAALAAAPDQYIFNLASIGASMRTGPYAGLSALAGLMVDHHRAVKQCYIPDLAEISWNARDLMWDVPLFADEMHHGPFQEAFLRLARKWDKESHGR